MCAARLSTRAGDCFLRVEDFTTVAHTRSRLQQKQYGAQAWLVCAWLRCGARESSALQARSLYSAKHTEVVKEASFDVKEGEVVKNQRMGVLWLDSDGPTVDETWHRIIERTFYSSQFQTVFAA